MQIVKEFLRERLLLDFECMTSAILVSTPSTQTSTSSRRPTTCDRCRPPNRFAGLTGAAEFAISMRERYDSQRGADSQGGVQRVGEGPDERRCGK